MCWPSRSGKSLTAMATRKDVVFKGHLFKLGQFLWRRRYFALVSDGTLRYYDDEDAFQRNCAPCNVLFLYGGAVLFVQAPKVSQEV